MTDVFDFPNSVISVEFLVGRTGPFEFGHRRNQPPGARAGGS